MSTTTMHFGPEWMRPKQGPSRPAPSPPLTNSPAPPGSSTYSALVAPATNPPPEKSDDTHPFRYTKDELLRIYKEGGGKGGLGIEVERWEGIVREVGCEPIGLKEMTDYEKKLFAGPLNSELRRRQSTDILAPLTPSALGERPKLGHANSATGSPMRERLGTFMGRRRGDSTDQPPLAIPRKLSTSSIQQPLASPRDAALPSPRARMGHTPGFDGVLSEAWSSRRRATDGLSKSGSGGINRAERDNGESNGDPNGTGIQEEMEEFGSEDRLPNPEKTDIAKESRIQLDTDPGPVANGIASNSFPAPLGDINGKVSNLTLEDRPNGMSNGTADGPRESPAIGPPPGLADVASIEWSYLDPQGQTQGPFRADVMQRWHDEGYFSADLLMKRTHLDTDWTSVGEMVRRAGNNPIFLTPLFSSATPPGLPRRPDPLLEGPIDRVQQHSPYQPVPTRSLRSSTFDSFMQNGSSAPESPASSFAGRYANASPDANTLDSRVISQHLYNDIGSGRMPGYVEPATGQRRATYNEAFDPTFARRPSYTHLNNGRIPAESLAFNGADGMTSVDSMAQFAHDFAAPGADAASTSSGGFGRAAVNTLRGAQDLGMANGHTSGFAGGNYGPIGGYSNQSSTSRMVGRDGFALAPGEDRQDPRQTLGFGAPYTNAMGSSLQANGQPYPQTPSVQYQGQQELHSLNPFPSISERQSAVSPHQIPVNQIQHSFVQAVHPSPQSPWLAQETAAFRRPGPFDPVHPTASNTVVIGAPSALAPQGRGTASQASLTNNQSPWLAASSGGAGAGWGGDSASLTVANLGQHNQQQQQGITQEISTDSPQAKPGNEIPRGSPHPAAAVEAPLAQEPAGEASRPTQKSRRKTAAQPAPAQAVNVAPAPAAVAKSPSPVPSAEPKAAWATGDDTKPPGTTLNLREIQEAEAKKLEARKAAERERERAARAAAGSNSQSEDFQSFTTSWGLPTSQAGAARTPAAVKDSPTLPTSTSTSTPAWTNVAKPAITKKTVKEIQEEEEKRKKQALNQKETVAAAARRAYAETTTKSSAPAVAPGGAWATVGSNGKAPTAAPTPARPAVAAAAPSKVVATTPAAPAPPNPTRPAAAVAARPSVPSAVLKTTSQRIDDFPVAPSHEFLKWMSESLKGLNSSVNYEEMTSMLLSFPLDPDPSTVEIISDLIYASSTTMDGRRFAAEFVNRRKADQGARTKGSAPVSASAKPTSIAEVVKAQPKPTQSEWGGFKVVNKKKKGGRS